MSGLLSHSKNSIPVWFRLFWRAEELYARYVLLKKEYMIYAQATRQLFKTEIKAGPSFLTGPYINKQEYITRGVYSV